VRFAYDLKARYALGRSVGALARELPLPLADWRRCGAEVLAALAGGAIGAGTGTTLRQLREALFAAPGREPEIAALWSESLATAAFAAAYAQQRELDPTASAVAGLLHRAGEAAALRALALAESASGIQVDADSRAQIVAQHAAAFLDALVRGWRLPPEVAVTACGWHHFGEFLTEGASSAVYLGHLLAHELLRPQGHTPGMAEGVAADLQLTGAQFQQLRAVAPAAQALIAALG
jgi:HD-like signal output (HDOD) protein